MRWVVRRCSGFSDGAVGWVVMGLGAGLLQTLFQWLLQTILLKKIILKNRKKEPGIFSGNYPGITPCSINIFPRNTRSSIITCLTIVTFLLNLYIYTTLVLGFYLLYVSCIFRGILKNAYFLKH